MRRVPSHPGQRRGGVAADREANPFVAATDPFTALSTRIQHLPIWIFHGESDEVIPVDQSRRLVAALKAEGVAVRYTEYEGVDYVGAASQAYSDADMLRWLFSQRRAR